MNRKNLSRSLGILAIGAILIGALALWGFPELAEAQGRGGQGAQATESWRGQGTGTSRQGIPGDGLGQNSVASEMGQAVVSPGNGRGQGNMLPAAPGGELSESEIQALAAALDDEYHAWAIYDQVLQDFGQVQPFTSILHSEESHIAALVRLYDRYGLEVPSNPWPGQVPSFDSTSDACAAAAQAEVDNAGLYGEISDTVDNPDILQVFSQLQRASETRHLPAFQRCTP